MSDEFPMLRTGDVEALLVLHEGQQMIVLNDRSRMGSSGGGYGRRSVLRERWTVNGRRAISVTAVYSSHAQR